MDNGFYLTGKFDEVASTSQLTTESYGSFKEAFTEYCNLVVESGKEKVKFVRKALEEAMSSAELLVLLETIPALNKLLRSRSVLGGRSQHICLRGADAEGRFVYIFVKFVQTISSLGYPIVLLLDDIQWASSGSIALLKATAAIEKERTNSRLLVMCTCRSDKDEILNVNHVLSQMTNGEFKSTYITVSGISMPAVHRLVCDVLGLEETTPTDLAEAIFSRTKGNPFHVKQLLNELQQQGLLFESEGKLTWDLDDIPFLGRSSSVTDIVAKRIERLPEAAREVLKVAACLGCAFSEICLMEGVFLRSSEIKSAIDQCKEETIFVCGTDAGELRFSHDKFQQATYMLIADNQRNEFHLNIGRRLLHWLTPEDREEHLMLIVDQISRGVNLIKDKEEKRDLAALFLRAGKKAAQASSFSAAVEYLKIGIQLLSSKCWSNQYELSLNLYNAAAEIEYYCGNVARVDELVETILKGAKYFDDTLLARFTKIYCLGSRGDMNRALEEGFKVLKCLGEVFPQRSCHFRVKFELARCKIMLRNKQPLEIINAPVLTDKNKLTAMRLMNIIHTFAFFVGDKCGPLIAARVVRRTLQHGMNELSKCLCVQLKQYFIPMNFDDAF
jgi:predicted ATPase